MVPRLESDNTMTNTNPGHTSSVQHTIAGVEVPSVSNRVAIQNAVHHETGSKPADLPRDVRDQIAYLLHIHDASYPEIAKLLGYYDGSGARKAAIRGRRAHGANDEADHIETRFLTELTPFGGPPR